MSRYLEAVTGKHFKRNLPDLKLFLDAPSVASLVYDFLRRLLSPEKKGENREEKIAVALERLEGSERHQQDNLWFPE